MANVDRAILELLYTIGGVCLTRIRRTREAILSSACSCCGRLLKRRLVGTVPQSQLQGGRQALECILGTQTSHLGTRCCSRMLFT